MEISENIKHGKYLYIGVVIPVALGLYLSSLYSYLLFHSLIEITTISIGFTLFILTWNARMFLVNNYLKILGIGYAFIALIDLVHTLAYKGMVIFPGYGANLPTQLWISARYVQAATLCAALFFMKRRVSIRAIFAVYTAAVITLVAMIFHGNFPDCFIDNKGLTAFKIISEYVITAFLLVSLYFLYRKRKYFDDRVFFLIVFSIICTVFSEISFTLFIDLYGFANMIGHFFKLAAFSLIYRAILITGIKDPYDLIFRDFKLAEESLKKAYDSLEEKVRERTAELSASEQLFRSYIENAPDGVFIVDETGHYIAVNRSACRITGYSDVEIKQMYIRDLLSEESLEDGLVHFKKIINTGAAVSDLWHKNKDGSKQCLTINAVKLSETRILGFAKDITKRKQMEEALRNSETRLKEAQRIARIGNWELDIINNVLLWSDEIYRIFDIDPAKFTASYEAFLDAIYPDDRDMVNNAYTESLKNRLPYEIEHRLLLKDGSIKYVNEKCVTYYGEDGSPLRSVGTVQDITERKKTEEKLTLLNYALDHVKESVFLIGEDMRFHYVNEESCRILGYSRGELLGLCVAQIDPEFPIERWPDHWKDLQSNASLSFESSHKKKDGCIFPVDVNANYFIFNGAGFNLALVRDITERKRIEIELKDSEARYRSSNNLITSILESPSNVGIYALDREYRFISFNQTYRKAAKRFWDADIFIGMSSFDTMKTEEHRQFSRQAFDQVLAGRTFSLESKEAVLTNGFQEYEYHDNFASPIFNDSGEVVGLTIFAFNITEQKRTNEIIHQLNINLSTTLQTIPDPLFELDRNGLCINAWAQNPKIRAVQKEFFIGHTIAEVFAPEYAEILIASIQEADEKGCSYGNIICIDYQGDLRWFELSVAKKAHIDGSNSHFIVLSRDITERRKLEKDVAVRDQEYRSLAENLPYIFIRYDLDCRVVFGETKDVHSLHDLELIHLGKTPLECFPDGLYDGGMAEMENYQSTLQHVIATGEEKEVEMHIFDNTGLKRTHRVLFSPNRDTEGKISGALAFGRDVTEQKETENLLILQGYALDHIREGAFLIGEGGRFFYVNDEACRSTGYTREELLNMTVYDVDPWLKREQIVDQSGKITEFIIESRHKAKDGHSFPVEVSSSPVNLGGRTYNMALVRDITERKQTADALQESEARYREIFENSSDLLFLLEVTEDGRFRNLDQNRAFENSTGLSRQQLRGKFIEETVSDETTQIVNNQYHRCADTGEVVEEDIEFFLPVGKRVYHSTIVPLRDNSGRIYRLLGISRDITERKQMENALIIREQEYRSLAENSPDNIIRYDRDCRATYGNHRVQSTMSDTDAWFLNKTPLECYPNGMYAGGIAEVVNYQDALSKVIVSGEIKEVEMHVPSPSGEFLVFNAIFAPERDVEGNIIGAIAFGRDISRRKAAEIALQESEEKFRTLFEQSADPQLILKDGVFIDFNRAAITFLGYNSKDEIFGLKPHEISPELQPDGTLSSEKSTNIINQVLIHGSKNFEWVHKKKNGDDVIVDITLTAIPLKNETIFYALFKDITEKKRTEKELQISERKYQTIFESSGTVMIIINGDGIIQLTNEMFLLFTGLEKKDVEGKMNMADIIDPEYYSRFKALCFYMKTDIEILRTIELRVNIRQNEKRDIIVYITNIYQTDLLIISFIDITETKHLEKEVLEISIREQQRIGRSLHDDLGQLLTGTGFLCESLMKKMVKLSFPGMDKIEKINNLIQNAKEHTRALARGLFPVDISSYGLTTAISRFVEDYEKIYPVSFQFICDSYIKLEDIIEIQLYYIIQESIINAINHGKANNIKINLSCEKNKLNMIIQDDGVGISANFEKVKGMGIRIMIYRSKTIGAELKISNVRKGGTKVTLTKQITPA